jgi:hypothetical protein
MRLETEEVETPCTLVYDRGDPAHQPRTDFDLWQVGGGESNR